MTKMTALAAALTLASLTPMTATAGGGVEVGVLTCSQQNQSNFVLFSNAKFSCAFQPANGSDAGFTANINNFGVDLSTSKEESLAWFVFAPTTEINAGSLEGRYVGASADAALGLGVGAKVLVGGVDKSIALQPASVTGSRGIGAAVGVETLRLTYRN